MRTTVVPAQITTVEDRIAGNLTFVQVILLVATLLAGSMIYLLLPPHKHLGILKVTLIISQFVILGGFSVRIKGKIVIDWLVLYLRFILRPRLYVFTKNDVSARDIVLPEVKKVVEQKKTTQTARTLVPGLSLSEMDEIGKLLTHESLTVRFALAKKGGIDVSLTPVE